MNILYNRLHFTTPCQSTWDRELKAACHPSHPSRKSGWTLLWHFSFVWSWRILGVSKARVIPYTLSISHELQYKGRNITQLITFKYIYHIRGEIAECWLAKTEGLSPYGAHCGCFSPSHSFNKKSWFNHLIKMSWSLDHDHLVTCCLATNR